MRVRYEMYRAGYGLGYVAECDLTRKQAEKRFEELKTNALCGWVELIAEDEAEGGYMDVIKSHDKIKLARVVSSLV